MKKVAKLVIIDPNDKYLLLYRSNQYPTFGIDPDLPGGTLEGDKTVLETMLREVKEESGIHIDARNVDEIYSGTKYSKHGTHYSLFVTNLEKRPEVILSWEHSSYEWLDCNDFLRKTKNAKDTYMHMVSESISCA